MGEKMSLQQVRDWAANTPASNGWQAKERDEAVAAIDAHLTQPAQAVDDGMLPDALVPHAKEWYRLCKRRFSVDRMTISGKLAKAIVETVSTRALGNANGKEG